METRTAAVDWGAVQDRLRAEVRRTVELLRSVRDPDAPAVGEWSVAEVAMHLSQAWIVVPGLARRDLSRIYEVLPDIERAASDSFIADIWDLGHVTKAGVLSDRERDPKAIADRIEQRAEEFLAECAGRSPDEPHAWMVDGTTLPLAALACHLLNETVMHGADVARAELRPWRIDRRSAVLIVEGFLLPAMAALPPRALVDQERAAGVRATYQVKLRGGGAARLRFDDGALHVGPASGRGVDCYLVADPVALLEVIWGRQSQWRAIAAGRLLARGRRPWLGPRLRLMMRNP